MRPRLLAAIMRAMLMAGVAVAALAAPGLAQPSQDARDAIFIDLWQLQDANLETARQISQIQRRAAAVLEETRAEGAADDPALREIIDALVANALTLASIILAPVATQDVAAGDAFLRLLEQNMGLVSESEPLFRPYAPLTQAIEQYAVMQVQTQDLAFALNDGWNRYAEALAGAEAAGLLPAGGFDPSARSWAMKLPSVDVEFAARAGNPAPALDERLLEPEPAALDHSIFGTVPDAEVAAALAREAERLAAKAPEGDNVGVPSIGDSAPDALASAGTPMPLDATGQAQPAAWMVMIGDNARAVARASNANVATTDRISSLQIGCHPNGTLRYIFEADRNITEYLVYANNEQHAVIRAKDNIVSGSEAIHMSDVLRLAFEWATGTAGSDAHLMVAAGDDPEAAAHFPVQGYLDARGRVLDGCLPWEEEGGDIPLATEVMPPNEAAPAEVTPALPIADDAPAAEDVLPALDTLAPVPRPRPASRMPVDLMNAG